MNLHDTGFAGIAYVPVGSVSFSPALDKIVVEATWSTFNPKQNYDSTMKLIAQEVEVLQDRQRAERLPALPVFYIHSIKPEHAKTEDKHRYS